MKCAGRWKDWAGCGSEPPGSPFQEIANTTPDGTPRWTWRTCSQFLKPLRDRLCKEKRAAALSFETTILRRTRNSARSTLPFARTATAQCKYFANLSRRCRPSLSRLFRRWVDEDRHIQNLARY